MKLSKKDLDYLAFLQEQMDYRRSHDETKIGKDERCTTEFMMLNMAWQEYLRIHLGLYPALDSTLFGTGKNQGVWRRVQNYRKLKEAR